MTGYKRSLVILSIVVVVLLGCVWELVWKCSLQRMDARAAWTAFVDYERTQRSLSKMGIEDTVAYLDAIAHTSLSVRNRHLGMIMQRERARAIEGVIQDLRKKTGEDLGQDPDAWIKKFYQVPRPRTLQSSGVKSKQF